MLAGKRIPATGEFIHSPKKAGEAGWEIHKNVSNA